jgi:hypothetical protein
VKAAGWSGCQLRVRLTRSGAPGQVELSRFSTATPSARECEHEDTVRRRAANQPGWFVPPLFHFQGAR